MKSPTMGGEAWRRYESERKVVTDLTAEPIDPQRHEPPGPAADIAGELALSKAWGLKAAKDWATMLDNLTATQNRCRELLEENRHLKAQMATRHHLPTAVREFHALAGQVDPTTPAVPDDKTVRLRLRLIVEEVCELLGACLGQPSVHDVDAWQTWNILTSAAPLEFINAAPVLVDLVEAADALADIAYVVEGSNLAFGIDGDDIGREVHWSNCSKFPTTIDEHGKIRKPAHYSPANVRGRLLAQGWQP